MINLNHGDGSILRCQCEQCTRMWDNGFLMIPSTTPTIPDTEVVDRFMQELMDAMSKPLPSLKRRIMTYADSEKWVWEGRSLPAPIPGVSKRFPHPWFRRNDCGGFYSMNPTQPWGNEFDPTKAQVPIILRGGLDKSEDEA